MRGLMMERPLLISSILDYAADYHGATDMVSRTVDQPEHRTTYAELRARAKKLANALVGGLGVESGDRIATLAWNDFRHFELYYGICGIGAVCHTINPRLFSEQIVYIVNHAQDRYLFADPSFLPLIEELAPQLSSLEAIIVLCDDAHMPTSDLERLLCYETLIADQSDQLAWPEFDENTASGLCYTSGTTGEPKGTLYSHRAILLHTLAALSGDAMGLGCRETVLPVVPMFHVNAWGLPYACPMAGAKMVMPGAKLDGASLFELCERERVTFSAGVPTVWFNFLGHLKETGQRPSTLNRLVIGGSAVPRSMIEIFEEEYGIEVIHAWGMTEMTPLGVVGTLKRGMERLPPEQRYDVKIKQGHAVWGVELKIVDDAGRRLPHDGKSAGILMVRGPWITSGYFRNDQATRQAFDREGWFATGDVATIDAQGYVQITDRAKDIIRSGGEWISSIDLENAAVAHPALAEAAVIGVAHPKWGERPLLLAVRRPDATVAKTDLIDFLRSKVARWWIPDDVVFIDHLPYTATGKIQKAALRDQYKNYVLPTG